MTETGKNYKCEEVEIILINIKFLNSGSKIVFDFIFNIMSKEIFLKKIIFR